MKITYKDCGYDRRASLSEKEISSRLIDARNQRLRSEVKNWIAFSAIPFVACGFIAASVVGFPFLILASVIEG